MKNNIMQATDSNFELEVLKSDFPALVDFWAPWCGPCLMVAPVLEEIADLYAGKLKVIKVNVDENPLLSSKYQIMSIPTLILFKQGQPVDSVIGALTRNQLINFLAKHLNQD
jgi:thioredoxin 1